MRFKNIANAMLALSLITGVVAAPAFAQRAASSMSIKVGYFNLALVKASYPEAAGADLLRTQAENELREYVRKGNESLQKAQEEKKPALASAALAEYPNYWDFCGIVLFTTALPK